MTRRTRGRRTGVLLAAVVLAATAAGCGSDSGDEDAGPQLANPASTYCEAHDGRVENVTGPDGQRGVCVLPDGTRVDEWQYYRSRGAAAECSAAGLDPAVEDEPELPEPVAAMRADLARAATGCEWDALAALAERNGHAVRFTFGAGDDPVAYWKQLEASADAEPRPMRALRTLLGLPFARQGGGEGPVQYVWPAAFGSEHPTDAELQEVADTGLYPLSTLREWRDSGTNYLGYRVLITASGDWTAFVAGD